MQDVGMRVQDLVGWLVVSFFVGIELGMLAGDVVSCLVFDEVGPLVGLDVGAVVG